MSSLEVPHFQPIVVPRHIPEKHLILMFPYTYFVYRTVVASLEETECHSISDAQVLADSERWIGSFSAFLEDVGTVSEDYQRVHS